MAAKTIKTRTPGVYRRGSRYMIAYRENGKQRYETFRTLDEARRAKAARATDIERGEFDGRSRVTLHEYAREWVERYQGRGRRGFRENTRDEYRRQLERFVLVYFPERLRLTEVTPSRVAGFVAWLCDEQKQGKALGDATVRNTLAPLRACLATAVREGLVRSNPARDVDLPHRPDAEEFDEEDVRAMSHDDLATLLALFPDRWRLFFIFLASTGVRISEAVALQWRHLELDGSTPHVKIRRAFVKGRMGPPKSKYGKREIPLDPELVLALRARRKETEWPGDDDLVWPASNGALLNQGNVRRRVLQPAREEACLEWVGFHAFRHTCASMLFAEGRNVVQVQRWLGHHSAAFTLATYVHLLDGDIGQPLRLSQGANKVQTAPTPFHATTPEDESPNPQR